MVTLRNTNKYSLHNRKTVMNRIENRIISFSELSIPNEDLYALFGYGGTLPSSDIVELTASLLDEISNLCRPQYGYVIVKGEAMDKERFYLGDKEFTPGRVITKSLSGCADYILLVATAGAAYTEWLDAKQADGDILLTFLSDAIGSAIAEATASVAIADIKRTAVGEGLKITNSYSPGYCDWHVSEQHLFFSMLPTAFCGITLNSSALMHPIKSVSCVIGVDENAVERPYRCSICFKKDCFLRIARSKA